MTTQNISDYISDTKSNILASQASVNTFAHAVDTNELLLKQSNGWTQWRLDHNTGAYQLPDTSIVLQHAPLTHVDVSDTRTQLLGTDQQDIRHTDNQLKQLVPQTGAWTMSPCDDSSTPVVLNNSLNGLTSLRFNATASLITSDLNVRTRPYHGDFTAFTVVKLIRYYNDWDDITLNSSEDKNLDGMIWGSHNTHGGYDGQGGQYVGAWFDHVTTAFYIRPTGNGLHQSHQAIISNTNEPYLSGVDLLEMPIVICSQYHSSHNSLSHKHQTTDPDLHTTGGSTISVNVCNYQKVVYQDNYGPQYACILNGLRFGGEGGFDLGEFVLFNSALERDEINTVGSHLANKWGSVWQS
jgi:hypothetical protein